MKQFVYLCCWLLSVAGSVAVAGTLNENVTAAQLARVLQTEPQDKHAEPPVITAVAIHPNGQLIAAAGDDHVVRLWSIQHSQPIRQLYGHTDWVQAVLFTPDGATLITAGTDGRVLAWQVQEETPPIELVRQQPLFDLAISPQGDQLFAVGFAAELQVVPLRTRAAPTQHNCVCSDMRSIAVSPDGRCVASGGRNGHVQLWTLPNCESAGEIQPHRRRVRGITFSRDSQRLMTAGEDRTIVVTNLSNRQEAMRLSSGPAKVLALAVCGDNLLASAGSDNLIRLWDLEQGTQVGRLEGHTGSVATLASRGQWLVSGSFDTSVRIWKVIDADELQARRKQAAESTVR